MISVWHNIWNSKESKTMFLIRSLYYKIANSLSDVDFIEHFTGFGLYDKKVIDILRSIKDPYPFFRGMLAEAGYQVYKIPYNQPNRVRGLTKNNFYSLYDIGVLGIISTSKIPLRLMIFIGLFCSVLSFLAGLSYFILKLVYWSEMTLGIAPLVIGVFFILSIYTRCTCFSKAIAC